MIGTVAPAVGRGAKAKGFWAVGAASYLLGNTASGVMLGALVGWFGNELRIWIPRWPAAVWVFFGALAILMSLREYGVLRIPLPQIKRQVPEWWRRRWHPWLAWGMYGLGLGNGLLTIVPFATYHIAVLGVLLLGDIRAGALVMGLYGAARALPGLVISLAVETESDPGVTGIFHLVRHTSLVRAANGALLQVFGTVILTQGLRSGGGV